MIGVADRDRRSRPIELLMVTPYAPYRDGIASYAVQEVRELRAAGVAVEVLSPLPSAAHHHLGLGHVRGMAALARRVSTAQRVVLQFSPEMIFGACRTPFQRVGVWGALTGLAARTELEIRLHEIEYGPLARNPAERAAARRALGAAAEVTVHTAREADQLAERLGLDRRAITVVDHGARFAPATTSTRAAARADLGLAADRHLFLAIGFLQEHKGFDRAVEAFGRAGLADIAELHVVGSVRVDHPDLVAYAGRLARLCRSTPGVELHQRYVSDDEFDTWIVAADTLVLPYREIWSSGVIERAKLYRRPVIAAAVGGLADQATDDTTLVADDEALIQAMKERAAIDRAEAAAGGGAAGATTGGQATGSPGRPGAGGSDRWQVDPNRPDRRAIEAQIRDRARSELRPDQEGPAGQALDRVLSVGPLQRNHAVSARPGVTSIKRLVRRATDWEVGPVAAHVDELQRAMADAVADLEARLDALEADLGPADDDPKP